jgi:hypothetical protein
MGSVLRRRPFAATGDDHGFGNLAELFADAAVDDRVRISPRARRLHQESVYTEPLAAETRSPSERESLQMGAAMQKTVADLMREPVPPIRERRPFARLPIAS